MLRVPPLVRLAAHPVLPVKGRVFCLPEKIPRQLNFGFLNESGGLDWVGSDTIVRASTVVACCGRWVLTDPIAGALSCFTGGN
jgi:hypothetical protein